jgi:sulfite exporter TauE/SafE
MERVDMLGMFMLGLFGTGHCVGMCGPLIFALPGRTARFMPHVWYHLGRVTTYAVIGGILGGLGPALAALTGMDTPARISTLQVGLRLMGAALLAMLGFVRLGWVPEPRWFGLLSPERIPGFKTAVDRTSNSGAEAVFLAQGLLLGLLPCGLSYGAFAQALGTASAADGTLSLLAFGLGTAPGLLLLGTGVAAVVRRYRRQSDIIAGILMLAMGAKLAAKAWTAI